MNALDGSHQLRQHTPCGLRDKRDNRGSLVSLRVVRGLAEAVECAGGSRNAFLASAKLDAAQLDSADACLSRSELYRLIELAMGAANDPALGLHWCERLPDSVFNPVTQLIRHAASLRQGLDTMLQFHGLLSEPPSYQVIETKDRVAVYCMDLSDEALPVQHFIGEMLVLGFVGLLRVFSPRAQLNWVGFKYPAPSYSEEYARTLGCPIHFEQPFTGIEFAASLLDLPSPYRDEDLHLALRRIAERRMIQVTHSLPMSWRVRAYLVEQGGKPQIDMPDVARALAMSTRSLRRRLNHEGVSFQDLAHEASASVAKQLLRDKGWSIQEAAYEMGFAHSTTFHRAFKRWTGTTPKEFREQQQR
jgi:AraC-like DNA-binding protein